MIYGRSIAIAATLAVLAAGGAEASAVCERLQERLDSAPVARVSNDNDVLRYSSALTRQNFEIRKTRQELQRLRCGNGSVVFLGQQSEGSCGSLIDAMKRMEENRQLLTAKIEALRRGDDGAVRSNIQAALEANGCGNELQRSADMVTARSTEGPQLPRALARQPLLNDMQGPSFATIAPMAPPAAYPRPTMQGFGSPTPSYRQGGLRTLCVRACDGAFFPISSDASPEDFGRDEQLCQQMCPGTDAHLYYHSLLGQESADMVSARTGEPYRNLSNAFAYLNRSPGEKPACGCNLKEYQRRAMKAVKGTIIGPEAYSSITEIRGQQTAPPPTMAKSAGQGANDIPPPPERIYDPASQTVRQVGPVFLPAETSSIDLSHPSGESYQPLQ